MGEPSSFLHTGREYIIPVTAARSLCSWSTPSIGVRQQQAIRLPCSLHSKCKQPAPGSEIHAALMCRGDQTLI